MRGLESLTRWALLDRTTQRIIMRGASLDKLRAFGAVFVQCGIAVDYRKEAYRKVA